MKKLFFLSVLFTFLSLSTTAQLRTKATFTDHAILQRGVEIPVTGWSTPNTNIVVTVNGSKTDALSDKNGKWTATLPPMEAGGPYKIDISGGKSGQSLTYEDIYFGDVWLCSGQSNMEWILKNTNNAEEVMASATDGLIRQFKVAHANSNTPLDDLPNGEWVVGQPSTIGNFTAVGYYFAKELRASQNIPIGLLNSSWGGSRIEPWISGPTLDTEHPEYSFESYTAKNNNNPQVMANKIKKMFPDLTDVDAGIKDGKPLWTGPMEAGKWTKINPLQLWETQEFAGVDGVAWYRTEFEATETLVLKLGAIDDNDMTWVNGQMVGSTNGYNVDRNYEVDQKLLRSGKNELLIRVEDTGGGGGLYETKFTTEINGKPLSDHDWFIRFGAIKINSSSNQIPNLIYNAMIHPIIDYPVKGVIWYQGESNTRSIQEAYDYRYVLRTLISDWRNLWGQENLPFYYVSLANFRAAKDQPSNDTWAVIRESMTDVLEVPFTGQAIITDIGNADDIHPRNKEDVGKRLALPARKQVYGENVVGGSPEYKSHQVDGDKVIVSFDQMGSGLKLKDKYGYVKGFSIAGPDGNFVWAKGVLEGDKVTLWNEAIKNPVAVRYAWETNPADANLFSKEGLPVTPFRTDDWDLEE
jgi:sialate O-acetylesterase